MMDLRALSEDLRDAERVLDYFLSLRPYESDDPVDVAETMRQREMAVEDVKERIKEIKEEIRDAELAGKGGVARRG
jgi:hypothetical protein